MTALYRAAAGVAVALALVFAAFTLATPVSASEGKITICHATGDPGHFNVITVSFTAAVGVPVNSAILAALAQSGHFSASGQPLHFRDSWGGFDYWLQGEATREDCAKFFPGNKG
jgi:hypothetical protein